MSVVIENTLNHDDEERINIIGLSGEYSGGIERFDNLNAYQLQQLIDYNFMELEECHNNAPSNGDVLEFLNTFPDFVAGGYTVSPEREDYRVSIESIKLDRKPTYAEQQAFIRLCRYADDFECSDNGCYAWFD